MIVTDGQQSLTEKVRQIIIALANRLTARENFGPEGTKGYVLTSNGEGPDDPPPSYQDIASSISNNPALKGEKGEQGEQGPQGDPGPAGADGGGAGATHAWQPAAITVAGVTDVAYIEVGGFVHIAMVYAPL